MSVIKNLFLITVSPQLGWEEINKSGHTTRTVLQSGLFPMLAVLALASFAPMFYEEEWTVSRCVLHAIAELSSFIAALYVVSLLLSGCFSELSKSHSSTIRMNNYIAYNLMYYVFIEALNNAMAYLFPPLLFLYFYLPVMASKGTEYLGIADKKRSLRVALVASLLMLTVPYIVRKLLELIINNGG